MLARLFSFVVWALVAATVVFWGLRLFTRPAAAPSNAVVVGDSASARSDLSRLLGAAPAATPAQAAAPDGGSRFRLLGIMAPRGRSVGSSGQGVALIAVDGKLPRAYTVGARVDGDLVLQAVTLRTVDIGSSAGAVTVRLELPVLSPPTTGTLAPGAMSLASPGGGVAVATTPVRPVPPVPIPQAIPAPAANRDAAAAPGSLPQPRSIGAPTE